jgi:hypothetical protein
MRRRWRVILRVSSLLVAVFVLFAAYVVIRNRPLKPTADDLAILERTLSLLQSESNWSREGDRDCDPDATRRNLYCALQHASREVTGEFHHRAAALQAVRHAIDRVRPKNGYAHRLQDFNNAPDVQLDDEVLRLAIEEVKHELTQP